jgi:hypothetical protein
MIPNTDISHRMGTTPLNDDIDTPPVSKPSLPHRSMQDDEVHAFESRSLDSRLHAMMRTAGLTWKAGDPIHPRPSRFNLPRMVPNTGSVKKPA